MSMDLQAQPTEENRRVPERRDTEREGITEVLYRVQKTSATVPVASD
jgi:hypothetical protein